MRWSICAAGAIDAVATNRSFGAFAGRMSGPESV